VRRALGRYAALGRLQARTVLAYRADYALSLLGLLLQIYLLRVVWTAVYEHRGAGGGGITLATMIAYSTLASLQNWLLDPWEFSLIPERVREGRVAADLSRPGGFLGQVVAGQVGRTVATLPFALAALPFAVLAGGARPPAGLPALAGYLAAALLGYLVTTLISVVVGLVTFWTMEVTGMFMVYRMASQFLSGTLVPLWLMPGWLHGIAGALPFQATTYTPVAIYLGQLSGWAAVRGLAVQCLWIVVLWLAGRWVWSRALHRVVVQGG
jgi:ABC-2 type transport system permease protein